MACGSPCDGNFFPRNNGQTTPGFFSAPPAPNMCPSPDRFFVGSPQKLTTSPPLPVNCPPLYPNDNRDNSGTVYKQRNMAGDAWSRLPVPINSFQAQGFPAPQYKPPNPPGTCLQFPHHSDPTSIGAKLGPQGGMLVQQGQSNTSCQQCRSCPRTQQQQGYQGQRQYMMGGGNSIPLRSSKSREIKSCKMISNCTCIRNNGLQDECRRSSCQDRKSMPAQDSYVSLRSSGSWPMQQYQQYSRYGVPPQMSQMQQSAFPTYPNPAHFR